MKNYVRTRPVLNAKLKAHQKMMEKDFQAPLNLEEFGLSKDQINASLAKYIQQHKY
jgi:hypothetical protein